MCMRERTESGGDMCVREKGDRVGCVCVRKREVGVVLSVFLCLWGLGGGGGGGGGGGRKGGCPRPSASTVNK